LGEGPENEREGPQKICEFRSAHRGVHGCQPTLGPIGYLGQHRLEGSTARCQSIAHSHGRTWVDKPFYDAFCFQLAQPLSENAVADSWDAGEQLVETCRSRKERFYHCPGPALAYQLDSALKGCAVVETPSDHGERFYALSDVSERTRNGFSTRNFSMSDFSVWDSGPGWT